MNRSAIRSLLSATALLAIGVASPVIAGEFDGVTIDAKLIGGQQYEGLYARIAEWESETGATVSIISKKSHFELDRGWPSVAVGAGWARADDAGAQG